MIQLSQRAFGSWPTRIAELDGEYSRQSPTKPAAKAVPGGNGFPGLQICRSGRGGIKSPI
jgi:hypothetical protein